MTMTLPETQSIQLHLTGDLLHVHFDRPEARNAMNGEVLDELDAIFDALRQRPDIRAVILRGNGGNFCAGGDVKDFARIRKLAVTRDDDPVARYNRRFGHMLQRVNEAPQATIVLLEGAVLGGGFGLACVVDVAIAQEDASFGLPETGLGIIPAQIAPFVVERIGLSQARRLGVCGARFGGAEALRLGLVDQVAPAKQTFELALEYLKKITGDRSSHVLHSVVKSANLTRRMPFMEAMEEQIGMFGELVIRQRKKMTKEQE